MTNSSDCIICSRWQKTPFAKRHTTPTTAQDTETAMVLGYWAATRVPEGQAVRMCERHSVYVYQLDTIEEARLQQERVLQAELASPAQQHNQSEFQRRAQEISERLSTPQPGLPQAPLVSGASMLAGTSPGLQAPGPVQMGAPIPIAQSSLTPDISPEVPKNANSFACPLCHKMVVAGDVHAC